MPSAACLWRAPPPNIYRMRALVGFVNHDFTKKLAPAWSFTRYVPPRKPPPKVSTPPFMKRLMRQKRREARRKKKLQETSKGLLGSKYRSRLAGTTAKSALKKETLSDESEEEISLESIDSEALFDVRPGQDLCEHQGFKYKLRSKSSDSNSFVLEPRDACQTCYRLGVTVTSQSKLSVARPVSVPSHRLLASRIANELVKSKSAIRAAPSETHACIAWPLTEEGKDKAMSKYVNKELTITEVEKILDSYEKRFRAGSFHVEGHKTPWTVDSLRRKALIDAKKQIVTATK